MGRFAMAWASKVCELHQQPNKSIILTISSWDPLSSRFSPPTHHRLPLPVDAELLVASVIHNFLSGESLIHAVLKKGSTLMIGCFDADSFKFEVLVEVDLPDYEQQKNLQLAAEECWLVDGPMLVVQAGGRFVIVHSSVCERSQSFDTSVDAIQYNDGCWHTYMLNLEGIGGVKGLRNLYCGELGAFEGSDLLLGLQFSLGADSQAAPSCRFREGWNFVRISTDNFSSENSKIFGSSNLDWQAVSLENSLRVCNNLFPSDVCLDLISCIGVFPRDPVTAVSSLANSADEDEESEASLHDVVIGYWNGKIVKYRMGTVVAQIDLEDAPVSLQFAIVAEGQGIVLCILNGRGSTVAALCAETLHLLKAWPGYHDVVIGDFQMKGHDQLLLLSMSSEFDAIKTASNDNYLIPQELTDLKFCYFSTIQDPDVPDLPGKQDASELHKTESLNAIVQCLKSRMEAGLLQMKSMEEQRVEKAELVKSSCGLLQEMALKDAYSHSPLGELSGKFDPSERIVKATVRQNGTCGRSWFLIVNIENVSQKDTILRDLSLSLTTIRGPISGSSSVVKSLCTEDKEKQIVTAVSLIDLPDASGFPRLHLLLSAKLFKGSASFVHTTFLAPDVLEDGGTCYNTWIGQIELKNVLMAASLDPAAVPLNFREVAPKHTFMINGGKVKEHHMEFVNVVKEALNMEYRGNIQLQPKAVHELVASRGALWADMTIVSAGEIHMVTLRAEDFKHLSVLKTCLAMTLEDKLELQLEAHCPEILNTALCFLKAFKEEIEHKKSVLMDDKLRETDDFETSVALECELQMTTDRHFSSFLAKVSRTDCM